MNRMCILIVCCFAGLTFSQHLNVSMIPPKGVEDAVLRLILSHYNQHQTKAKRLLRRLVDEKSHLIEAEDKFNLLKNGLRAINISSRRLQDDCNFTRSEAWTEKQEEMLEHCRQLVVNRCRNTNDINFNELQEFFRSVEVPKFFSIFNLSSTQHCKHEFLTTTYYIGYRSRLRLQKRNISLLITEVEKIIRNSSEQLKTIKNSFNHKPHERLPMPPNYGTRFDSRRLRNDISRLDPRDHFEHALSRIPYLPKRRGVRRRRTTNHCGYLCSYNVKTIAKACAKEKRNFLSVAFARRCPSYNRFLKKTQHELDKLPLVSAFFDFFKIISLFQKQVENLSWIKSPVLTNSNGKIISNLRIRKATKQRLQVEFEFQSNSTTVFTDFHRMAEDIALYILRHVVSRK